MGVHYGLSLLPSLLLGLACLKLVLCEGYWGGELEVELAQGGGVKNHSTWICDLNKDYRQGLCTVWTRLPVASVQCLSLLPPLGPVGVVDKENCKASCSEGTDHHEYLGYIGAMVAVVFFGSNFVPVKKYETGDGNEGCGMACG